MSSTNFPKEVILGYAGEQNARTVEFDCSEEFALWPNSAVTLMYSRPGEEEDVYKAAVRTVEIDSVNSNIVKWTPDAFATEIEGTTGYIQLFFVTPEENAAGGHTILGKSAIVKMSVRKSLTVDTEGSVEEYEEWLTRIMAISARAEEILTDVTTASQSMGGFSFYVDPTDGHLKARTWDPEDPEEEEYINVDSFGVDDALSDSSTNPVQNQVITGAIDDVKDALSVLNKDGYKTEIGITWTQGRISPSTGGPVSSDTTAIYSSAISTSDYDFFFYAASTGDYTIAVYEYTGPAWADFTAVLLTETTLPLSFTVTPGRYYRLVVKKTDGTALSPSGLTDFTLYHHASQKYIIESIDDAAANVIGLQSTVNTIKEETDNLNTAGQGRFYVKANGTIGASSDNYIGLPTPIPCDASTKYSVNLFDGGVNTTSGFYTAFYDTQGTLIGSRENINTGAGYAVFESPATAASMAASVYNSSGVSASAKISIIKGQSKAASYVPPVTAKDMVARNLVGTANRMITACNTALNKKIITWIDDDTGLSSIQTVKSMCDTLGIKCTFACITSRLSDQSLVTLLKSYQEAGFHITCHSHTHSTWYGDDPYDADEVENDLIISLETLQENGFLDSDMLVYPGSSPSRVDVDVKAIAKKWCRCGVKASGTNFTGCGDGEFLINRVFFDASSHNADYYTDILDGYTLGDAPWVVFGSHSSDATQFDETLIETVAQYALTNGWTFMTLNEAIKYRQKYFDIKEMYGL